MTEPTSEQNPAHEPPPVRETAPETASAGTGKRQRSTPRSGPIVWGTLILIYCGYVAQRAFAPDTVDQTGWVALAIAGLGLLLLGVGVGTVVRGRR